jgi:hypothetical protein
MKAKHKNMRDKNRVGEISPLDDSCPAKSTDRTALILAQTGCRIEDDLLIVARPAVVEVEHLND